MHGCYNSSVAVVDDDGFFGLENESGMQLCVGDVMLRYKY